MSEDWNVQASYKFGPNGGHMLNVRAADEMILAARCQAITEHLTEDNFLGELADALGGATAGQATTTITNAFPNAQPAGPMCAHGAMKDLSSKGYRHRWYCPAPKGTPREQQCPARD